MSTAREADTFMKDYKQQTLRGVVTTRTVEVLNKHRGTGSGDGGGGGGWGERENLQCIETFQLHILHVLPCDKYNLYCIGLPT